MEQLHERWKNDPHVHLLPTEVLPVNTVLMVTIMRCSRLEEEELIKYLANLPLNKAYLIIDIVKPTMWEDIDLHVFK